jgi:serine/threonine protein kinase
MQKARKASGISRADTLKADLRGQRSGTQIGLGNPQIDTIPNPPLSSPETSGTVKKSERDYYEIISLLGQGGMGKVFKVRHIQKTSTGKVVIDKEEVMKTMSYDAAAEEITDPEEFRKFKERMYDRFITEVQLVSKLDHPNIVRISDFSETEDGEPYFVMEYLEGSDLHNIRAQAGELSWEQVRSIMLQVCDAFTEAHEYEENGEKKPIIHRDIKPMNIFIVPGKNREQLVKVLDFGLAKIMSRTEDGVTKTGETAGGTPDYMSPEQIFGLEVDHRTDIYALGIVMYELLTGQVPFLYSPDKERSDFETSADYFGYINEYQTTFRNMVWENPPMPPSEFMAGIPPEGERIVLKCLEKNSSKRYQSARELRADLENARALSENGSGIGTDSNGHLPSVIINQNVLAAAERERNTILEQINQTPNGGNPYKGTMIVRQRGPIYQQKKKKWNKWIAIGAVATAVMAAGGIAGVSYQKQSADAAQAAQSAKVVPQERQPPEEPITEPIQAAAPADSGVPDTVADEVVSHEISIRSNVSGVSVYIGNDEMCNTGRSRDCSMQLEESQEQVTLTFMRRGFQDERQMITPDSAKSLTVRLQPLPRNPRTTKSGAPMITSEE